MKNWKCRLIELHDYKTTKRFGCKVPVGNTFTGRLSGNFNGEVEFQECQREGCDTVRCVVRTGNISDTFPVGQTARSAIRNMPHLQDDPLMLAYAQL
jgi:hypothetical protein